MHFSPVKKAGWLFLVWLFCPLWGAAGEQAAEPPLAIPELTLTAEDTTVILPPFEPCYDAGLRYSPRLGLLLPDLNGPVMEFPPLTSQPVRINQFFTQEQPFYIQTNMQYRTQGSLQLGYESLFRTQPVDFLLNATCFLPLPGFTGREGAGERPQFDLELNGTRVMAAGSAELSFYGSLAELTEEETIYWLSGENHYQPASAQNRVLFSYATDAYLAILKRPQGLYRFFGASGNIGLELPETGYLPRFYAEWLAAGVSETALQDWLGNFRFDWPLYFLDNRLALDCGIALLCARQSLKLFPEAKLRYWITRQISLLLQGHCGLAGITESRDLVLQYPQTAGFIRPASFFQADLKFFYTPLACCTVQAALTYYAGTWNMVKENQLLHQPAADLDLNLDLSLELLPAFSLNFTYLQGLVVDRERCLLQLETCWQLSSLPLEWLLHLNWQTAPAVLFPGRTTGSQLGLQIRYEFPGRLAGTAGGEINGDQDLNFLDYNLFFSVCYTFH